MNVSAVQEFLRGLAGPLTAAGAPRKITDDLLRIAEGLEPFRDQPLAQFADFLVRAEEYHRTGVIPVRRRRRKEPDPAKVLQAAQEFKALAERAWDAELPEETLHAQLQQILEPLSRKELLQVLQEVGGPAVRRRDKAVAELKRLLHQGRPVAPAAAAQAEPAEAPLPEPAATDPAPTM
jgi:hypothetical protein